jgi:cell division protein FtsI/penicillin-binding protein 2
MQGRHLTATVVVQDVSTGAVVVAASSQPSSLEPTTQLLPLSLSKVFLAASWWDENQPDQTFRSHGSPTDPNPAFRQIVNTHEILVGGSDSAGEQMAIALRHSVGTQAVLSDLYRYGFNRSDESHLGDLDPQRPSRVKVGSASATLADLTDEQWGKALSIGETHMQTTPLQVSEFLQAVGNHGIGCALVFKQASEIKGIQKQQQTCHAPERVVKAATAGRIMAAMTDTVKRGTASSIAAALHDTGWSMGGKTGTGGRVGVPLSEMDGCFAGLIFDIHGNARFTIATFVREGGTGGGNAALISAAIARYLATGRAS